MLPTQDAFSREFHMLRNSFSLLVAVLMASPLFAQQPQRMRVPADRMQPGSPTPEKAEQPKPVPIEQKLRYIVKQLDLNQKQQQHADGLFAILQSESNLSPEETKDRMEMIMSTYHTMQEAEKAGDKARADQLREELRNLAPGAAAERNFVNGLMPVLNDQQKEKFQTLLQKLDKATDLSLKPVEVIRLARDQNLTPEQTKKIADIQEQFRQSVAAGKAPDSQALDQLISDVAGVLNPTQRAKFEQEISSRRVDAPATAPTTKPAAKP
jgi:hypothetical protein